MTDIVEVVVFTTNDVQGLLNQVNGMINSQLSQLSPENLESFNSVDWDDPFWADYFNEVMAKIELLQTVPHFAKLTDIPPAHFFQFCKALVELDQESICPVNLTEITQIVKQQDATKIYVKFEINDEIRNDFTRVTNRKILHSFTCHIVEE